MDSSALPQSAFMTCCVLGMQAKFTRSGTDVNTQCCHVATGLLHHVAGGQGPSSVGRTPYGQGLSAGALSGGLQ